MAALELNFYNEEYEVIKTYSVGIIRWGMFKKALELSKSISTDAKQAEAGFDGLSSFICDLFNNQFTVSELEQHADIGDVFSCYKAVINKAKAWGNA